MRVRLRMSGVNAFADGKTVNIASGMMRFVESDDELALIIGHEMGHMDKKQGNAIIGAVVDGVIAGITRAPAPGSTFSTAMGGAFSQDFESEADYVGAYYAARVGDDISQAKTLWRRMAAPIPWASTWRAAPTPAPPSGCLPSPTPSRRSSARRRPVSPSCPSRSQPTDLLQRRRQSAMMAPRRIE